MSVHTNSTTVVGLDALKVEVETEIVRGLKRFSIVGLPDGIVKEAKDRVKCAIENSGFDFPNSEVIVNLAPASLPKNGSGFDLAISMSILAAHGILPAELIQKNVFVGELTLDGRIKHTGSEVASAYLVAENSELDGLYVSYESFETLKYFPKFKVHFAENISDLVGILLGNIAEGTRVSVAERITPISEVQKDFSDVVGQFEAKRALMVAAAGGHNVLLIGPPGGGKTMLAERIISILPDLAEDEFLEVNKIHSILRVQNSSSNSFNPIFKRQFRSPHHSISLAGLVGGGSNVTPGEISLAHNGVLFLDELPEMRRDTLEALREPLEKRKISISRANGKFVYPANFMLIAAMNPCPCGLKGTETRDERARIRYKTLCKCSEQEIKRYLKKISGPLLDRIDIQLWLPQVSLEEMHSSKTNIDVTAKFKLKVFDVREKQFKRFRSFSYLNSQMTSKELNRYCSLTDNSKTVLNDAGKKFQFSARAYTRVLKLARTIADLNDQTEILPEHLVEALSYRLQLHSL